MDLADTITGVWLLVRGVLRERGGEESGEGGNGYLPAYPFFERSMAICRPIPREAPITSATF